MDTTLPPLFGLEQSTAYGKGSYSPQKQHRIWNKQCHREKFAMLNDDYKRKTDEAIDRVKERCKKKAVETQELRKKETAYRRYITNMKNVFDLYISRNSPTLMNSYLCCAARLAGGL